MAENKSEDAMIAEFELELIKNHLILTPEKLKVIRKAGRNMLKQAKSDTAEKVRKLKEKCKDAYTPSLFKELEAKIDEIFPDSQAREFRDGKEPQKGEIDNVLIDRAMRHPTGEYVRKSTKICKNCGREKGLHAMGKHCYCATNDLRIFEPQIPCKHCGEPKGKHNFVEPNSYYCVPYIDNFNVFEPAE